MPSRGAQLGGQLGVGLGNALGGYFGNKLKNKRMDAEFEKIKAMGMGTDEQNLYMQLKFGAQENPLAALMQQLGGQGGGGQVGTSTIQDDTGGAAAGGSDPKINVIQLSTGTPGMIPISEFDPKLYRRAQ